MISSLLTQTQSNGTTKQTLSFIAPALSSVAVACFATKGNKIEDNVALIQTQG